MKLTGLHLLLTYQCTLECDHCFVWGSPQQTGTMTLESIERILQQAQDLGTIEWIYFEGGEPFLYYPVLLRAAEMAGRLGFQVGMVSNGYWATSYEDALEWLRPFADLLQDLSISSDLYHGDADLSQQVADAQRAAQHLGISVGIITIAQPEATDCAAAVGQLPIGQSAVMYRGRAAEMLTPRAARRPWKQFTECPYEDLRNPDRVHVDPFGNLHICQGISLGNIFETPLTQICDRYDPLLHPAIGPLVEGGPAELLRRHRLPLEGSYADACHLCYEARRTLRDRFPETLTPDQMYGVVG